MVMAEESSPTTYASVDDIHRAFESLSDTELLRIHRAASICMPGTEYSDPQELINEVIARALRAANGQRGRRWPLNIPFIAFLMETFKGLASDSRESIQQKLQKRTVSMSELSESTGGNGDVLVQLGRFHADPESQFIESEEIEVNEQTAQAVLDKIEAFFADDQEVTWIVMGHRDQLPPAEICALGDMTQSQYEAARKRFRRGLRKLFPGGRPS
jgi:hypothetical protein